MIFVIMKKLFEYSRLIELNAPALGGVFTYADLASLINCSDSTLLPNYIQGLLNVGVVRKFIRGFYVSPRFDPLILSQKICSVSYLSLETVLAESLVIGSVPTFQVTAVKLGRTRIYKSNILTIEHLSTSSQNFWGFQEKDGIKKADPEKAFIDVLYFYQKGRKPIFDIYSDVNVGKLDIKKTEGYLQSYRNPKFVAFVTGVLNGYR